MKYYYPTSALVTAYDIITFWVSKMVVSGLKFMGKVPFKDVVVHGLVKDIKGVKMSKHLGNGIDPIDMIEKYGADALRLSLINGMSMGGDVKYSEEKAKDAKIFINKLYNASKFVLQNVQDIKIKSLDTFDLKDKDKWILSNLDKLIKTVNKNLDNYAFSNAVINLIEFTISKFCDYYIEISKVDLYGDNEKAKERTQNVLYFVLVNLLKLFHPFIPFVTEYIYKNIPEHEKTIMLSSYPQKLKLKSLVNDFDKIIEIIKSIRNARAEAGVSDNKRTSIYFMTDEEDFVLKQNLAEIARLAGGINCEIISSEPLERTMKIISGETKIYIPMGQLIDSKKEKETLDKAIENIKFEIARSEKMLSNQGFVAKAPKELVENEQIKLENNRNTYQKLLTERAKLED